MSLDREEELIGESMDAVPKVEPDEYCRGKKILRDDENKIIHADDGRACFGGYCRAIAGKGTDHLGEGRCKHHGGCSTGAPAGNQNSATHSLNADPDNYYKSLDREEKEYIQHLAATIRDRIRSNAGDVDYLDRVMARRIAIELHIVSKASDHVMNVAGLTETIKTGNGNREQKTALLSEIRKRDRAIFQMLKDLGVLDDPTSQQTDALESWRNQIEEGQRS